MRRREALRYYFKDACKHKNVIAQLLDVALHKLKINTSWEDYYRYRFYDGEKSWSDKALYIGNLGSRYWPQEGNSLKFERIFQFKSVQKSVLQAAGFPTPELLLRVGRNYAIDTPEKFSDAMMKVSVPFLTKNDGGAQGIGIYAMQPCDEGFLCGDETVDANWIWQKYEQSLERGFLVETRVTNHPLLAELYPYSLNTIRLNTIKTADNKWHMVGPFLKLGQNKSPVDNISAGGLMIALGADGIAQKAYCRKTNQTFARHPETNCQIEGFQVPHFAEAVDMALSASQLFGYMASIGWDIGITPTGPTIVEGNLAWGLEGIQEQSGPLLTTEIAAGLAPRSWWTPWDKTHTYPDYEKYTAGGCWQRIMARRRNKWKELLRDKQREKSIISTNG